MSKSGREGRRDRDPGEREWSALEKPAGLRVFRITDTERQDVARSLRFIDHSRRALEEQQNPLNREIIRELQASADRIFDVLNELEEIES